MKNKEKIEELLNKIAQLNSDVDMLRSSKQNKTKELLDQINQLKSKVSSLQSSEQDKIGKITLQQNKIKRLQSKLSKRMMGELLKTYLPLIITVVGLIIAWKAYSYDKKVAEVSGVFKKSDSSMTFANLFLATGQSYNLEFGYMGEQDEIVFHELPLGLLNSGEITDDEMSISFKYFKNHNLCVDTFLNTSNYSPFLDLSRDYYSHDGFEFSTYKVEKLNPKTSLRLGEIIHLNNTEIVVPFDSLGLKVEYQYKFDLILTGIDKSPEIYTFNVSKKSESDISALIKLKKKYLQEVYASSNAKVNKDEITFFITPSIVESNEIIEVNSKLSITRIVNDKDILIMEFDNATMQYWIYKPDGSVVEKGQIKKNQSE